MSNISTFKYTVAALQIFQPDIMSSRVGHLDNTENSCTLWNITGHCLAHLDGHKNQTNRDSGL